MSKGYEYNQGYEDGTKRVMEQYIHIDEFTHSIDKFLDVFNSHRKIFNYLIKHDKNISIDNEELKTAPARKKNLKLIIDMVNEQMKREIKSKKKISREFKI